MVDCASCVERNSVAANIILKQCQFHVFGVVPVLVDVHLFAATHMPYVMGKLKEHVAHCLWLL